MEPDYGGAEGHFDNDIAILVLSTHIKYNIIVSPICLDWNKQVHISSGTLGKVMNLHCFNNIYLCNKIKFQKLS